MENLMKFPILKGEMWRMIFGTGEEYYLSNFGRVARCDGVNFHLWSPLENACGEFGINLEILIHSDYIKKGTFKFYQMQRLMAIIWLSKGDRNFIVTKRNKQNSDWQIENLNLTYKKNEGKFQGKTFSFWRKFTESDIGLDIKADFV